MKKTIALLVLLNFVFLLASSASAQRNTARNRVAPVKSTVQYGELRAFTDGGGALLEWETQIESENLGFFIYRISGNQKVLINDSFVPGRRLQSRSEQTFGQKYSFFDNAGGVDSRYVLESLSVSGARAFSAEFAAQSLTAFGETEKAAFDASKQGFLKKNPIIEKTEAVAPEEFKNESQINISESDFADNLESQKWVAAQPGVKIGVKKEGIYRVTKAELANAGFDVSSSPELWQLYRNGVEQAIIVATNGDYIEFYGEGIDARDSDTQIYFLVVGSQPGKRMSAAVIRRQRSNTIRSTANSYPYSFIFKERTNYYSGIFNGEADNFFGRVITSGGASVPLTLKAIDFSSPNASLELQIQGVTFVAHQVKVVLNGQELGFVSGYNTASMTQRFDIPTSLLVEGNNTLTLTGTNGTQDISSFDNVKINYARKFKIDSGRLSFYTIANAKIDVTGFASNDIRVFDLTAPDNPGIIGRLPRSIGSDGLYQISMGWRGVKKIYAMDGSAFMQVASISANSPSTISTANHAGKLVIVSYKDWMTQANAWADYRRAEGLAVEVVNIEDIYDEFSFGIFNSDAIKSFLQFARNNWQTPPEYVLLVGDASHDPRRYTSNSDYNFVPTKIIETFYLETGSDEALADFDNDGLSEIAIGRIPVQNAQEVVLALNKVASFEQNVADGFSRGFLFASDEPNGYDFLGLSNRLKSNLPVNTNAENVNINECYNLYGMPNPSLEPAKYQQKKACISGYNTLLMGKLNQGKYLVNYSGHGNTAAWSYTEYFSKTSAAQITSSNYTIFSMLTCLNGYFIQNSDSISETLLKNQNGGAVASWASTGETTPDVQEVMATRFFSKLGVAPAGTRMGDLIKDAKTTINGGRDVRLSWALLGDPTLKVR